MAAVLGLALLAVLVPAQGAPADPTPPEPPAFRYHLTARPWKPLEILPSAYLDRIEGECRFWARHQDPTGALIDPYIRKEWQYSTPYFAYAVGTLVEAGRAEDLLERGVLALDHACAGLAAGKADGHDEFFVPPLAGALALYAAHVPAEKLSSWQREIATVFKPHGTNNWRTYFMKGQWLRVRAGLVDRAAAIQQIEGDWAASQRSRISTSRFNLYHDTSSDPDSLAVEAVGRGNLLALAALGYDGPSAGSITADAERGTAWTLLLEDPSGQAPTNGRTDDHAWVDVGYQLAFDTMAERAHARQDPWRAGQYRHAAELAFRNIERWRRGGDAWGGSFFVTKNTFDPSLRVGYQDASQYSNYNGSILFHTAEAYHVRRTTIPERPAPVEIGGYALSTDEGFSAAFANAGGMAMEIDLRGATRRVYNHYWTALGVVRLGRPDWDTRLGPSDGVRDASTGMGVSFAPTWEEAGTWVRLASVPERYRGAWSAGFVHPLLVRCSVLWSPRPGDPGPTFQQDFTITPDGVLSEVVQTKGSAAWGMTYPLIQTDGESAFPQSFSPADRIASVGFPGSQDTENFILVGGPATSMVREPPLRSSYGDLSPLRVVASDSCHRTWIYPSGAGDPGPASVRDSFVRTADGWRSCLGRVEGTLYVGRTSAGGVGTGVDLAGKGIPDVTFSARCGFILQLDRGAVRAVETDTPVTASVGGHEIRLEAHTPVVLSGPAGEPH